MVRTWQDERRWEVMAKLTGIEVLYTFDDGSTSHATMAADAGWQQWGNTTNLLYDTVVLTESIARVVYESGTIEEDDEEDDED